MSSESKTCQACSQAFAIDADDLDFYKKIGVPEPTFCSKCRFARRLAWRNERSLYKRACDSCGAGIISMYLPRAPFPVYCHDCWWSDTWSPLTYGRAYDFSVPFFEQFTALQRIVPKPATYATGNTRSEYCNYTAHMKDSYLMFGSWFSENCGYGQTVLESKDCWNCLFIKNCELCLSSFDCTKCYQTHFSEKCTGCSDSAFLYDCRNCQNCLFSFNLRNKSYYVSNKQVSKDEYEEAKRKALGSASALEQELSKFRKMVQEKALHRYMAGERNTNVSGEFIYNSKNVHQSYYIHDGENEKYAVRGGKGQKDSMDVFGVHAGELAYECNNIDFSSRSYFCVNGENNMNVDYLVDSFNIRNSFGCISLRQKEYCILNKQYDPKEYTELRRRIIDHMQTMPYRDRKGRTYAYGEFFPIEIAPCNYNETLAQEYVPITRERAADLGYLWHDVEEKQYATTKSWKELPDTIAEVGDTILSEFVLCRAWDTDKKSSQEHNCTKAFKIIPNELSMYRKWGVPLPRECPNSRNFEMFQLRNPVSSWRRKCLCNGQMTQRQIANGKEQIAYANSAIHFHGADPCPNEFETSYGPDRAEIVYCEQCYQAEVA